MKKTTNDFCGILNSSYFLRFTSVPLISKPHKIDKIKSHISNYWEFEELKVLGYHTKSDMTSKYGTIFFIITRRYKWENFEIEADTLGPSIYFGNASTALKQNIPGAPGHNASS